MPILAISTYVVLSPELTNSCTICTESCPFIKQEVEKQEPLQILQKKKESLPNAELIYTI